MRFVYTNYKNITSAREILPHTLGWLDDDAIREYGYQPGLFITGHDVDKNAQRSFSVRNIVPLSGEQIIHDFTEYVPKQSINVLVEAAKRLVNSVKKDEFGTPLMQFKDGNGGLVSKETIALATQLEQLLDYYK